MTVEIERRFLIENDKWHRYADEPLLWKQAYLSVEKERTVRVRIVGTGVADTERLYFGTQPQRV